MQFHRSMSRSILILAGVIMGLLSLTPGGRLWSRPMRM